MAELTACFCLCCHIYYICRLIHEKGFAVIGVNLDQNLVLLQIGQPLMLLLKSCMLVNVVVGCNAWIKTCFA